MHLYRDAVGLDVGSHSVKGVRVKRCAGIVRVVDCDWAKLPALPSQRQKMLRSFVSKKGWNGIPCAVSLPDNNVIVRSLSVGDEDPRSINRIVQLELAQFEELAQRHPITSYRIQQKVYGKRYALLALGRSELVDGAIQQASVSGLDAIDAVPEGLACLNAMLRLPFSVRRRFINVQAGSSHTTVLAVRGTTVLYTKHISLGMGSTDSAAENNQSSADCGKWLDTVSTTIKEFGSQLPESAKKPDHIILSGGCALVPGLAGELADATGIKVSNYSQLARRYALDEGDRLATALGCALIAAGKGRLKLSLQPDPMKERLALRRQRPSWVIAGAALNLAIAFSGAIFYMRTENLENLRTTRQTQLAALRSTHSQLKVARAEIRELRKRIAPFAAAVHNARISRVVMQALAEAKSQYDWVTRITDSDFYFAESSQETSRTAYNPQIGFRSFIVEGYTPAPNMSSVRHMIEKLRTHAGILDADLLTEDRLSPNPDRHKPWKDIDGTFFAIEIRLPTP
ncbi:MAG: type IV pilus biogenesis protein PilM [Verrucomicrobiota bacterium]